MCSPKNSGTFKVSGTILFDDGRKEIELSCLVSGMRAKHALEKAREAMAEIGKRAGGTQLRLNKIKETKVDFLIAPKEYNKYDNLNDFLKIYKIKDEDIKGPTLDGFLWFLKERAEKDGPDSNTGKSYKKLTELLNAVGAAANTAAKPQ